MLKKLEIRDMLYSALFAALIAVLGYVIIPLPFSPVPITGQTLAVMLAGCVLTPLQAGLSVITFIFMGAVGIPVFSGGASGIGVIVGTKGGYLLGFLIGAIVISLIKGKTNSIPRMIFACIIGGILIVYILGVPWLSYVTGMEISKAITVGALLFIPGDLLKAVAAGFIAKKINAHRRNRNV
jgi:biotin transport system substrate-specific component